MRRRIPYRVCQCTPYGIMTQLETRILRDIVNREIHPIRCAASCKRKYQKGLYIGNLCAETGHLMWAMKVWNLTINLIEAKDYIDWRNVWFNNEIVSLRDVVSETECELLSRRCSDIWRILGHPEYAWWDDDWEHIAANTFGSYYDYLWIEKYDYDPCLSYIQWEETMSEIERVI